jgi:hypothetical protein
MDRALCAEETAKRLCFWVLLVLSLPIILSIALNLFPLFPMDWQHGLAVCHRFSALGFMLTALGYVYLIRRTQGKRNLKPTLHSKP